MAADYAAEAVPPRLRALIGDLGSVAVAFSAGVDSTYLLAACVDVLGAARVLAVTACSPSLPAHEQQEARALAAQLGVRLELLPTHELTNPAYVRNDGQRCFHCKDELFTRLHAVAQAHGLAALAYGATADDQGDHRPGMQAARQHSIHAPLLEAGLGKAAIRALSQRRGLPTHDKPALACLASRIPYGSPITAAALAQVAAAEQAVRQVLGVRQVRVRHHGSLARIELEAAALARLAAPDARAQVVARLMALGYTFVTLDLAGFRSGSLNALLPPGKDAASEPLP